MDYNDVAARNGRHVTFKDILSVLKENMEKLDLGGTFLEGLRWIHGATFQVSWGT
jgi:hypothetical protein